MNETIKNILNRRSCKNFNEKICEENDIMQILECGRNAPSALNLQSAKILYIKDKEIVEDLRTKLISFMGRDPFHNAKTIIVVYGDKTSRFVNFDGTCILETMFIAATSLNIASCWINCLHDYFATEEGNAFKKEVLHLGDELITIGTCVLGYCDEELKTKNKKEDFIRII